MLSKKTKQAHEVGATAVSLVAGQSSGRCKRSRLVRDAVPGDREIRESYPAARHVLQARIRSSAETVDVGLAGSGCG